jgi:hypothetical protein
MTGAWTCQDLVWKIEGKVAKFSTTTFTYRSTSFLLHDVQFAQAVAYRKQM